MFLAVMKKKKFLPLPSDQGAVFPAGDSTGDLQSIQDSGFKGQDWVTVAMRTLQII